MQKIIYIKAAEEGNGWRQRRTVRTGPLHVIWNYYIAHTHTHTCTAGHWGYSYVLRLPSGLGHKANLGPFGRSRAAIMAANKIASIKKEKPYQILLENCKKLHTWRMRNKKRSKTKTKWKPKTQHLKRTSAKRIDDIDWGSALSRQSGPAESQPKRAPWEAWG